MKGKRVALPREIGRRSIVHDAPPPRVETGGDPCAIPAHGDLLCVPSGFMLLTPCFLH